MVPSLATLTLQLQYSDLAEGSVGAAVMQRVARLHTLRSLSIDLLDVESVDALPLLQDLSRWKFYATAGCIDIDCLFCVGSAGSSHPR